MTNNTIQKQAGPLMDEIKYEAGYILDGIKRNHISKSEAGRSAAIGAIAAALAGAGIGALTGKKGKKWKRALKGALIGALTGGDVRSCVRTTPQISGRNPFRQQEILRHAA